MQKRGISGHIDWIIGMGLFLLSIGAILVLFKPGITPVTTPTTMLDLLQDKFTQETEWNITKLPIFVSAIKYIETTPNRMIRTSISGVQTIKLQGNIQIGGAVDLNAQLGNSLKTKLENAGIENSNNIETYYIQKGNEIPAITYTQNEASNDPSFSRARTLLVSTLGYTNPPHNLDRPYPIKFAYDNPNKLITFKTSLEPVTSGNIGPKTKHLIIFTNNIINPPPNLLSENPTTNACTYNCQDTTTECTIESYNPSVNTIVTGAQGCKVLYSLGVAEEVKGISLKDITQLQSYTEPQCGIKTGYECIKQKWNFPKNNNFRIKVSLAVNVDETKTVIFPTNIIQPENVRIYARTYSTQILTDDAETIPARVTLQIW